MGRRLPPIPPGTRFGRLVVEELARESAPGFYLTGSHDYRLYLCRCDCGGSRLAGQKGLLGGHIVSCGCLHGHYAEDLTGRRFGRLVVLRRQEEPRGAFPANAAVWLCRCDCGLELEADGGSLRRGNRKDCGCGKREPRIPMVGRRFGRLLVVALSESRDASGKPLWRCVCDCGNELDVRGGNLRGGRTRSCGCLRAETLSARRRKAGK